MTWPKALVMRRGSVASASAMRDARKAGYAAPKKANAAAGSQPTTTPR